MRLRSTMENMYCLRGLAKNRIKIQPSDKVMSDYPKLWIPVEEAMEETKQFVTKALRIAAHTVDSTVIIATSIWFEIAPIQVEICQREESFDQFFAASQRQAISKFVNVTVHWRYFTIKYNASDYSSSSSFPSSFGSYGALDNHSYLMEVVRMLLLGDWIANGADNWVDHPHFFRPNHWFAAYRSLI